MLILICPFTKQPFPVIIFYMKLLLLTVPLALIMLSCQEIDTTSRKGPLAQGAENKQDTLPKLEEGSAGTEDDGLPTSTVHKQSLVLTSNALQLVDRQTGASTDITFGKPIEQMLGIVSKVLLVQPSNVGINSECGAGPLKMASWSNGLTVVFQEQKTNAVPASEWRFVGWYMGDGSGSSEKLNTFAGIGIGSARAEMESAYVINVQKTSLGYEFSTAEGLYGIFDGGGQDAKITSLWSGLSCNFR